MYKRGEYRIVQFNKICRNAKRLGFYTPEHEWGEWNIKDKPIRYLTDEEEQKILEEIDAVRFTHRITSKGSGRGEGADSGGKSAALGVRRHGQVGGAVAKDRTHVLGSTGVAGAASGAGLEDERAQRGDEGRGRVRTVPRRIAPGHGGQDGHARCADLDLGAEVAEAGGEEFSSRVEEPAHM